MFVFIFCKIIQLEEIKQKNNIKTNKTKTFEKKKKEILHTYKDKKEFKQASNFNQYGIE